MKGFLAFLARITREHQQSYGQMGDWRVWVKSVAITAVFLLVAILLTW